MASIARSFPEPGAFPTRVRLSAGMETPRAATASRWSRGFIAVFVFLSFFPYPAVAIGTNNGLQLGQLLALAAVGALILQRPSRACVALLVLLVPLYLSAFLNSWRASTAEPAVLLKESIAMTSALIVLWPAGWLASRWRLADAMLMATIATLIHVLIGLYQVHAFNSDEFPLLWLYRNPSFKDMAEWAPVYATYIKRPCGLFPEPSAMASALGPWLVLLVGRLAGGMPTIPTSRRTWWLTAAAVLGGFLLLALSRSGSVAAVIGGAMVGLLGRPARAGRRDWLTPLLLGAAGIGVVAFVAMQVSTNLDERIESSWGLRSQSIAAAVTGNTEPFTFVVGIGAGQSSSAIRKLMSGVAITAEQGEVAVWSLAASYYMDNGLIGGFALLAVMVAAVRSILTSSAIPLGLGALLAWTVAVTVTTSYMALPPVWLFLGAALSWNTIFPGTLRVRSGTA